MSNKLVKKKGVTYKAPMNVGNMSMSELSKVTGARIDSLKFWCAEREKEISEFYAEEARKKLWKAEDYVAVANILISLVAIKMTWGFTKANQRFLDNINPAKVYLERNGVQKVYEQLHKEMGIELEFDSIDINKEFGFVEEREND